MANLGKNTDSSTTMKNRGESNTTRGDMSGKDKSYGGKKDYEPMKVKPTEEPEEEEEDDMPEDTGIQSKESSQKDLGKGTFGGKPYGKKDEPNIDRSNRGERPERGERPSGFGTGRGDIGKSGKDSSRVDKKEVSQGTGQQTTYGDDDEEDQ